jgi:hypothetical protein
MYKITNYMAALHQNLNIDTYERHSKLKSRLDYYTV